MQEEVNDKTIALSVKTAKLTGTVLKVALQKFLSEIEKQKQKGKAKAAQPKQGKQTMKQLMQKNTQITNIEVTDGNIKSFERVARKYGIDFSLKKDASENPPKYIVFFKARDVDVMTAAFKEYTANDLKKRISRLCVNVLPKQWIPSAKTRKRSDRKQRIGGCKSYEKNRSEKVSDVKFPILHHLLLGGQDRVAVPPLCGRFAD